MLRRLILAIARKSQQVNRLADPTPMFKVEPAVETEIVVSGTVDPGVEIKQHETFVKAVQYLLYHPAVRVGGFDQIVITNLDGLADRETDYKGE